jgi:hypothetical protein
MTDPANDTRFILDGQVHDLAGPRMSLTTTDEGVTTVTFSEKGTGKQCGDCQLCCRLLPIAVLRKPANVRCQFQGFKQGCKVHGHPTLFPAPCRLWSCLWLGDPDVSGLPRPDRAHYVLDMDTCDVPLTNTDGETVKVSCFQIWVDPAYPDAWRTRALRAWMAREATRLKAGFVIRWGPVKAMLVLPPVFDHANGEWHEIPGTGAPTSAEKEAIVKNFVNTP